ncbi:histone-lysine N-methyltransferase PRDM9 isoform X2 [Conger conger]|nr:histone-lysine N-methyltransferase PRDM9 isoform X2 [Conger conger]XP_061086205.1 histone-lysine N-methyltransferase PRDM9 isoform X2 [Conger conger]
MKSNISSLICQEGEGEESVPSPGTNSTSDEEWHPSTDRRRAGLPRREKCLKKKENLPQRPVLNENEDENDQLCDDQFYCEECQSFYFEECETHGPPSFTHDSPIPLGVPQRALLTLPPGMVIGRSSIPGAGLGVFNQGQLVPVGMHFGPFEGEVTSKEKAIESSYSWVICRKKNQYEFIDAIRDSHSNWMRYVSCARSEEEQNLVAFQHRGRVLYRSLRLIPPGQELLVWYADEYAKELGIIWDSLWNKKCTIADVSTEEHSKVFPCMECQFSFTAEVYLHKHIRRSHPEEFTRLQGSGSICSQCGRGFSNLDSLKEHQCAEAGERPHCCSECGRTFTRSCHLKRHERTIHIKEKPYCCSQCGKCFSQSAGLKRHQHVHTGGRRNHGRVDVMPKVFPCLHCTFSFTSAFLLHKHMKRHHPEELCGQHNEPNGTESDVPKQLPLSDAPPDETRTASDTPPAHWNSRKGKIFKRLGASAPAKRQKAERPFPCSQCGKSFRDAETLKGHQCETEEGPFHCLECGRSFTRSCNLKRHQRTIHTKEKPYCCSQCGKCFSQSAGLKRHQQIHADGRRHHQGVDVATQVFSCSYCTFSFTAERYLYKHRKRYHPLEHLLRTGSVRVAQIGDGPNFCSQCGKSFSCLKSLKAHHCMRVGEKLYLCTDCGKSFSWFYGLRQHQRIHTGEKPFGCTECGKHFVHSGQLNVHMRTHTGEKPFLCTECGESFRQSGDLKRHEWKHTGVRPCRCDECGKSFSRPQSLKAHQQLHTGEKLYHCSVCGKSFARSWHLRRHHQKMHSS